MRISRKRSAEAMEDDNISRKRRAGATEASPDVVEVNCFAVGIGEALGIQLALNAQLISLKESIKSKRSEQLKDVVAEDLQLFLAKKADNSWLSADPSLKNRSWKLLNGQDTITEVFGNTSPSNYLHLIVKAPLPKWTIKPEENTAVAKYRRIADDLKESEEVKALVKTLETVRERDKGFIVLENSSGTGKTQMARFTSAVYQAFDSRQHAFNNCLKSDIADMNRSAVGSSAFDGSIGDFKRISVMKRLKVYAFIIAALRGDNTFMGDALLEDVRAIRDQRSKPIVFFLDEFLRVGDQFTGTALDAHKAIVQSMRNVFRFLRLPLIISSTNDTARRLVSPGMEEILDGSTTPVFEWIIQNSRPLFGALAKNYMRQFPFNRSGQDELGYLTTMVGALTPKFRHLKLRKGENAFEKGQLYLFLGSSYSVNNMPIRPRDDDVDDNDDDDGSQEDSDEEMSEAESDESSCKEVNLIDVHYGRMEDQEIFELKWAIEGLEKNRERWKCRCVPPAE